MERTNQHYNRESIFDIYHLAKTEMDTGAPRTSGVRYLADTYDMKATTANAYLSNVVSVLQGRQVVTSLGASQWRAVIALMYDDYGCPGVQNALRSLRHLVEWNKQRGNYVDSLQAVVDYWELKCGSVPDIIEEPPKPQITKEEALDALGRILDALNDLSEYIKEH